jgi:RES domain-containing protein
LNLANCKALSKRNIVGIWYRAVIPHHLARAVLTAHTETIPGRFSPGTPANPGFEILYLAENPLVAMYEVEALYGSPIAPVPNPTTTFTIVPISVDLSNIVDLTDAVEAELLQTTAQELTGDWRSYTVRRLPLSGIATPHAGEAPTQRLGRALFSAGDCLGFKTFSAKRPEYTILGIFSQRLSTLGGRVQYKYPDPNGNEQIVRIP